ncbi:SCO family protein [Chelativorans sp. Marseille-P2723]|uniref:SCO family protein n=1 Tax=Chelativorans sp. Marseille-P2723 TaxID=2709133 RepID=UPI00156E2EBC|nr:SCO family protein [Chelativorans sp. Marseille-P2723]
MMRYILIGIVALIVVGFGAMGYFFYRGPATEPFGAPFELVDHNGQTITEGAFRGNPTALFFGFTHCPDVCPTTLFEMEGWIDELGDAGDELRAFFVTVDPERDTPEVMKTYLSNFSEHITGITGDPGDVAEMIKSFHVFARKVELEDGDYTMDHTASVMLIGRDGDFFGTIAYGENAETALVKLRRLIEES